MTSGTFVRGVAPGSPGIRYTRTWSGNDWPVLPRLAKPPLLDPVYLDKKGRRHLNQQILANNRKVIESYKAFAASLRQRQVKRQRERRYQDHPYTTLSTVTLNDTMTVRNVPGGFNASGTWTSLFGGGSFVYPTWTPADDYALIEKLKTRIMGSEFNLGVFAAEFSEAAHMIFNAANRLQLALKAASKGRWGEAVRHLRPKGSASRDVSHFYTKKRTTAQNWLELQYGWLPLISDLDAGARMLAHMTSVPYELVVRVKRSKVGTGNDNSSPGVKSSSPSNAKAFGFCATRKQIIARLREVDVPQLVGLTDFASIVWERLPYSFVADWVIPIGNYLSARGIASALSGTFVTTSSSSGMITRMDLTGSTYRYVTTPALFNYRENRVDRTISTTLSVPKPSVKPLSKMLTWAHAANAVSLLILRGSAPKTVAPARKSRRPPEFSPGFPKPGYGISSPVD